MNDTHLVFVYGSLKEGFHNNRILANAALVQAGAVTADACYTMKSLEYYPAVFEGGTHRVRGEVYEVDPDLLKTLDALEGHPFVYERKLVPVEGMSRRAWMYLWRDVNHYYFPPDYLNPEIKEGVAEWMVPLDD